jgi:hypothetical protein
MKAPTLTPIVTLVLTLLLGPAGRAEAKGTPGGGDIHASPAVGITNADAVSLNLTNVAPVANGPCDVMVSFLDAAGVVVQESVVTLAPQQSTSVVLQGSIFPNSPSTQVRAAVGAPPAGQGNAACRRSRIRGCVQVLDGSSNETKAIFDAF